MSQQLPSNYNFVPVPTGKSGVVYPEWSKQVSHDIPFEDGICGELEIELKNESPLFICGTGQDLATVKMPYTNHEGKAAIPGTSLRGMLRTVTEIATWGKLENINKEHIFGLRDLHTRHLYGDYMADIQERYDNRQREPMTLVNAGWLYYDEDEKGERRYFISPCNFARVEYGIVEKFAKAMKTKLDPNRRQSAAKKYQAWGPEQLETDFNLPVKTLLQPGTVSQRAKLRRISEYGEAKGGGRKVGGRFVFTGQPQARRPGEKRKKHHDFFFFGKTECADIEVSKAQFDAFERIHSDGAERHAHEISPNEEWKFWKKHLRQVSYDANHLDKRRVPVFFIVEPDKAGQAPQLRSFGLAMMFRLAYDQNLGQVRDNTQQNYQELSRDFAELMYGYVNKSDKLSDLDPASSLRGRISIGQANLVGSSQFAPQVKAVLSAPKPTYYPAYVIQGDKAGANPPPQRKGRGFLWTAYMKNQTPKLRGWKRYLVRHRWETHPPLPEKANDKVTTTFKPIKEGACFRFKIRVHNLKPQELGALLWSINFGGDQDARHLLGMGKGLGYGKVQLKVTDHCLFANRDIEQKQLDHQVIQESLQAFREYMNQQTNGKWAQSETLSELLACATPHPSGQDPDYLRAPLLNHRTLRNEFQHYKKQGKALALHGSDRHYREAWKKRKIV